MSEPTTNVTEMVDSQRFRGDPTRLARDIEAIASVGAGVRGVTRPGYTKLEREAHRLVAGWLSELGLEVRTDPAGNTLAELPAAGGRPAVGTGSHLDSVPSGGRYDGVAGVVAAIEVIRRFAETGTRLSRPLRVVCFAAEEGARFGQACLGSRAAAGMGGHDLEVMNDVDGVTAAEAMRQVGLDPAALKAATWRSADWAAFVELHVEQGTVLESHDTRIGIVDLVSGSTRVEVVLTGQASHSGGTPMRGRHDALSAAAEIVLLAESVATDARHHGTRATIGRLSVSPGSITTIVGKVILTIDVRDTDSDRQRSTIAEILVGASDRCRRRGVDMSVRQIADTSPTVLPVWLREVTAEACRQAGVEYRVLSSGASHDAQTVASVVPAGVIFVPSRSGLSHVPEEWTSAADLATGVDVLARTLIGLDEESRRIEDGQG